MTTAPLAAVAASRISVSTASCSATQVCSSGASPSPCCSSAPGPVTYPSSDIVMSAITLGIAVSSRGCHQRRPRARPGGLERLEPTVDEGVELDRSLLVQPVAGAGPRDRLGVRVLEERGFECGAVGVGVEGEHQTGAAP